MYQIRLVLTSIFALSFQSVSRLNAVALVTPNEKKLDTHSKGQYLFITCLSTISQPFCNHYTYHVLILTVGCKRIVNGDKFSIKLLVNLGQLVI